MSLSWNFQPFTLYSLSDAVWMSVQARGEVVIPTMFDKNFRVLRNEKFDCKLRAKESYILVSGHRMAILTQQQLSQYFDLVEVYPKLISDRMTARIRGSFGRYLS